MHKNKPVVWTELMLTTLKEDYMSKLPKKEMEIKYKRNWGSIRVKCNNLGYKRGAPTSNEAIKINLPEKDVILLYESGKSMYEIAKIYNCSHFKINTVLKTNDIKSRSISVSKRFYTLDESCFEVIDSEEKAYFLGLLFADGCNRSNYMISITLQKQDKIIFEKFNYLLKTNRPIGEYTNKINNNTYYTLYINSKKISQDLINLGCIPNKSFTKQFPNEDKVPLKLQHHFIRGYFDGNGCIHTSKNYSQNTYILSIDSSEQFLLK